MEGRKWDRGADGGGGVVYRLMGLSTCYKHSLIARDATKLLESTV
jgi:hypothetical protein